jgi:thioredoxin reductase
VDVLQPIEAVFDVIVVGGGPAGLSAALMLGRCCRRVLLCDQGTPRNRRATALHGYLTRDGIAPGDFNALGRQELARYGVEFRVGRAIAVTRYQAGFGVSFEDNRTEDARFLLLATGVEDELPPVSGLEACYGRSVFHCPYCDGWEWRDRRLAVLGHGTGAVRLAMSLRTWSSTVALCTNGRRISAADRRALPMRGLAFCGAPVDGLEHTDGLLEAVVFRGGGRLACDGLFFPAAQHPQNGLAAALGCSFTRKGTVDTGRLCETNVSGVFVAGDASRDAQFVVVAAAEGVKAAVAINQALQRADSSE